MTKVVSTNFWIFQHCWDRDLGLSCWDLVHAGFSTLCPTPPSMMPFDMLFSAGHLPLWAGGRWESSSEETAGRRVRGYPLPPNLGESPLQP